jgi:alpha-galactosidase
VSEQEDLWKGQVGPFSAYISDLPGGIRLAHRNGRLSFERVSVRLAVGSYGIRHEFEILPVSQPRRSIFELRPGLRATGLTFMCSGDSCVEAVLQLAWMESWPRLMWRVRVTNSSESEVQLHELTFEASSVMTEGKSPIPGGGEEWKSHLEGDSASDLIFYHNGWQSWSHAGWLQIQDPVPVTSLGLFTRPMQLAQGFSAEPGMQASDMFTVVFDRRVGRGCVAGFLSQKRALGQIHVLARASDFLLRFASALDGRILEPGRVFESDWACLEAFGEDTDAPAASFLAAAAQLNNARVRSEIPVGWCTWYYYFGNLSESDVCEHVDWISEHHERLPLDLVQIDDGFQERVGDWFDRADSFRTGLKNISSRIRSHGLEPGIWLAPFLAHPSSNIVHDHPDWVLKDVRGKPVNPGWGWNGFPRVLDITHPDVLEHLSRLIETAVHEWGFSYLKLDFLYAGALCGNHHDRAVTRAEALVEALRIIREAAGKEVILVGCGAPLGPAIGFVDAMRIGPDVAPSWYPRLGILSRLVKNDPGFPSVRNAIRNVVARSELHGRWWINDPDCLLVRTRKSRLSAEEVHTFLTAAAFSGGSLLLSDRLPDLNEERIQWAARLLPPLPEPARDISWQAADDVHVFALEMGGPVGSRILLAILNTCDRSIDFILDRAQLGLGSDRDIHCLDFWHSRYNRYGEMEEMRFEISPHACRCLALRQASSSPQWVGSSIHISQGLEVLEWTPDNGSLSIKLGFPNRSVSGSLWLQVPGKIQQARFDGKALDIRRVDSSVYRCDVSMNGVKEITMGWEEAR